MNHLVSSSFDTLDRFIDELDDRTLDRAEDYYLKGKINSIEYSFNPLRCQASVAGSKRQAYSLHITEEDGQCFASCSCPVGYNCKHIGAVLFYLEGVLEYKQGLGAGADGVAAENKLSIPSEIKNWIASLRRPMQPQQIETQKQTAKKQVIFILRTSPFHLKIDIQLQSLKKDGSPSKTIPNALRLDNLLVGGNQAAAFFTEEDWGIISHAIRSGAAGHTEIRLKDIDNVDLFLKKIADTGRLHFELWNGSLMHWGDERPGNFEWESFPEMLVQRLVCRTTPPAFGCIAIKSRLFYVDIEKNRLGPVLLKEDPDMIPKLLQAPPIPIEQVNDVLDYMEKEASCPNSYKPKKIKQNVIQTKPTAHLLLEPVEEGYAHFKRCRIAAAPHFQYETHKLAYSFERPKTTLIANQEECSVIQRDFAFEDKMVRTLSKYEARPYFGKIFLDGHHCGTCKNSVLKKFLEKHSDFLTKSGWKIDLHPDFSVKEFHEADDWYVETEQEDNGWLSLEMGIEINGVRHNLIPLIEQITSQLDRNTDRNFLNTPFFILTTEDGIAIKVPAERIKKLIDAFSLEFKTNSGDKLKISEWNLQLLNDAKLADEAANFRWFGDQKFLQLAKQFNKGNPIEKTRPPKNLETNLRPYQREGLDWLHFLRKNRLSGILADDMGLGKTIQVLSYIQSVIESEKKIAPILVIVPKSLIFNWVNEIKKHAPSLSYVILHGDSRKGLYENLSGYDVAFITYSLLAKDKEQLLQHHFYMLVLDEAQNIKNSKTQTYAALQLLKADHRLCLSGTPIENHLGELWSIVNFLMPGYLGKQKVFNQVFRTPIEKNGSEKQKKNLNQRLSPIFLRRNKELVAKDLPPKTEIIERVEFDEHQRDLYEMVRIRVYDNLLQEFQKKGINASKIAILDAILKLRQVCCDPRLLKTKQKKQGAKSAKLGHLMGMIPQLIEGGSRVLLFSQFTSMLELIEAELHAEGIEYSILTGQTINRQEQVARFQNRQVPLMLLSLKAGGVGLNLTEADTVIHYDPWWNPAVENQATDRAHRIGQTKKVFIYKLIVNGSIEEKILDLQQRKKTLASVMSEEHGTQSLDLSRDDIDEIFRPLN